MSTRRLPITMQNGICLHSFWHHNAAMPRCTCPCSCSVADEKDVNLDFSTRSLKPPQDFSSCLLETWSWAVLRLLETSTYAYERRSEHAAMYKWIIDIQMCINKIYWIFADYGIHRDEISRIWWNNCDLYIHYPILRAWLNVSTQIPHPWMPSSCLMLRAKNGTFGA